MEPVWFTAFVTAILLSGYFAALYWLSSAYCGYLTKKLRGLQKYMFAAYVLLLILIVAVIVGSLYISIMWKSHTLSDLSRDYRSNSAFG